jgi:hypothetical protein
MVYFETKYTNLIKILENLGMENVGIFYDHLEYFTALWYNLWPFGIGSLWSFSIFFPFWYVWTKKNLATLNWLQVLSVVKDKMLFFAIFEASLF